MFDFCIYREPVWPNKLEPYGEGSSEKESFNDWWNRFSEEFNHLHPLILEQWVHRHWLLSEFSFIPLDTLGWKLVSLSGEDILSDIKPELWREFNPEFDYDVFQNSINGRKLPTVEALDSGTWDYPIIALYTPNGWRTMRTENHERIPTIIDERYMLIEGHQRYRYLNALHAKNIAPEGKHKVFVIQSPLVS